MSKAKEKGAKDKGKGGKAKPEPGLAPSELWEGLDAAVRKESRKVPGLVIEGVKPPLLKLLAEQIELCEEDDLPPVQIVVSFPLAPVWLGIFLKSMKLAFSPVNYTGLTSLCFWTANVGAEGAMLLSNALSEMPNVKKLELIDCGLNPDACENLGMYLRRRAVAFLKILRIDHNDIGDFGVKHLTDALYFNSALNELSLRSCNMGPASGQHLARGLAAEDTKITKLNLAYNSLGGKGLQDLAAGIAGSTALAELDLSYNGALGDDSVGLFLEPLAAAFVKNLTLRQINLVGNLIGPQNDSAVQFLSRALAEVKHIYRLDVTPFTSPDVFKEFHSLISVNKPAPTKKKKKKVTKKD